MRYKLIILFFLLSLFSHAQTDYSDQWEDFYSYNNVKEIINTDTQTIALSDNAIFIYDKLTAEIEKISSVNGLSGETTSTFYYDSDLDRIVIGYETGLVEIIDADRSIFIKPDIINFNILGSKRINQISANGTTLYFSTPFGIVVFDLVDLVFKDTYFIGNASSEVLVNETTVFNDIIYAATENGVYSASINEPFLIDFNNWNQYFTGNFSNIEIFNTRILVARNTQIFEINNNTLQLVNTQSQTIKDIQSNGNSLVVSTQNHITIYDNAFTPITQVSSSDNPEYNFDAYTALATDSNLYIGTKNHGVLKSSLSNSTTFEEIHPEGPISNQLFSFSVKDEHLWVVYGGRTGAYGPLGITKGASHYNGENWITVPYAANAITERDLVHVNIDPSHENRVYISSWRNGMLIIEDDQVIEHWNEDNTGLEQMDGYIFVLVSGSVFDDDGNLWVANAWTAERLKKRTPSGTWSGMDLSSLIVNNAYGTNKIMIDNSGNKWIGTRRNGVFVVSKNGDKIMSLTSDPSKGDLPDLNVHSLAVDKNNKVWIGTKQGLVVFNSSSNIFDSEVYFAKPIVLAYGQDDNFGEALLGNQSINAICIDGAENKWFGTDSGGVLYTNPSGQETLLQFDKSNSPLASNRILEIQFDASTGKVYFGTENGIVAFNSNVAPFGNHLEEVYAYPNPVKKQHDFVTIDGRNGGHLPKGTNVKILDAAGKLVYETNVVENQERYGGKVVWDKTNLAGRKVASGVYMVLLTIEDASETSMCKIAIIN